MIFKTYMNFCDEHRRYLAHRCVDLQGREIASGMIDFDGKERLTLSFAGKDYKYGRGFTMVEKPTYDFPYPFTPPIKKTPATDIISDGKTVMQVYREAGTYKKVLFLKHNFIFHVYLHNGRVYHCYKVGFANESDHYYCLKTPEGETVAVMQRHMQAEDDRRATVYLKDKSLLELVLLAAGFETMLIQLDIEHFTRTDDPSAGNYISVSDAEKAMFDKDFIPAVKAMHGIYD